ncbi:MAG: histidine kinase [Deltaproteobacteria bacterium]|nr:MAG: histidine kinase [Deltaproteobacteria bacterium]
MHPETRSDDTQKASPNASEDQFIKALMDIGTAITSDLYLEDILKLIVMATARIMDVEICSLWLIDTAETPPRIRLKATQAINPDYIKDRSLSLDEGVVGAVATHGEPLMIADVLSEPLFKEKKMAEKLGLVSMLGVPLIGKGEQIIGVFNCFTLEPRAFTHKDVMLISAVANQAAIAILNTELMVKTKVIQEELETRKLLDRAKAVIMRRRNLTGDEAFRWIKQRSTDSRNTLRQVAEAVLLSEDLEAPPH